MGIGTDWDHTDHCGVFWRGFSCCYPHREGNDSGGKECLCSKGLWTFGFLPAPLVGSKAGPSTPRFLWG